MSFYSISLFTQKLEVSRMVRSCILPRVGVQFAHVSQLREALDVTHGGKFGLCGHMKFTQYFLAIRFVISIFSGALLSFFVFFWCFRALFFCFLLCPSILFWLFFCFYSPVCSIWHMRTQSAHWSPSGHRLVPISDFSTCMLCTPIYSLICPDSRVSSLPRMPGVPNVL